MLCNQHIMPALSDLADRVSHIAQRIIAMEKRLSYDFAKLDTAQTDIVGKMDALIASVASLAAQLAAVQTTDPTVQAHIDAVAAALEAEVAKASPAPAPAPVTPPAS
jgi:hypothetical protein